MIDLKTLPEPKFITAGWEDQQRELISAYEEIVGEPLSKGQLESLLLAIFNYRENLLRIAINEIAKQNLLAYAKGEVLDHLGALLGVYRLPAKPAVTTLRFTFDGELPTDLLIPKGTRVQSKDGKVIFATDKDLNVPQGSLSAEVTADCLQAGSIGNGYLSGMITELIDPLPYVEEVENISVTYGGADTEDDDNFRGRIQIAPESFSNAGSEGAYQYWAKTAHQDIVDVAVWSPEPGAVKVTVLMKDGELPSPEILTLVSETLNHKKRRPLTDRVIVEAPEVINYEINAQLYIYSSATMLSDKILTQAIKNLNHYAKTVKEKLGRDIVPEQILNTLQSISGVYRAVVTQPEYTTLGINQVAMCNNITVTIAGSVND